MLVTVVSLVALAASGLASPIAKGEDGHPNGILGNPTIEEITVISEVDYFENGQIVSKSFSTQVLTSTIYGEFPPVVPSSSAGAAPQPTSSPCESGTTTSPEGATATVPIQSQSTPQSQSASAQSSSPPTSSLAPTSTSSVQPSNTIPPDAFATGFIDQNNDTQTFIDVALYHHNVHRFNHSAPAIVWNETVFEWAKWKSDNCTFNEEMPPGSSSVGMNIAGGTYGSIREPPNLSVMISEMWYNSEIKNFPQYGKNDLDASGEAFEGWGHFSQIVWPSSIQLGCGLTNCGDHWFGACLYSPSGNILDHFAEIGVPEGHPIVFPNGEQH